MPKSNNVNINNRRLNGLIHKLLVLVNLFLGALLGASAQSAKILNHSDKHPPNIVIFIADDLNMQDVGAYGNIDVHTPNMDRLSREGMQFSRAYAASSMCTPSRSALFTGMYPHHNGAQMNHFTVNPGVNNLPQILKALGYRVVISGKTDVFPLDNFPFEVIGKEFGKYEPIENRVDRNNESVHLIETHFKTHRDQPLCLIVAPWLPHVPWFPHKDFVPEKIKIPAYLADTKETRSALASYYQSIAAADEMLGRVLTALDKVGETNNTITFFTSDQGAQFPSAKWSVYDKGLHVPLIVRWPGHIDKFSKTDALVSLVDITPTLIDLAGGKKIDTLDGLSFKSVLFGHQKQIHDYIFGESSMEPHYWYNYTPGRTIITADGWQYIRNYHPGERFITHIDKVERNEFYFDSWVEAAKTDYKTRFLLNRYSYHPPEELFNLNQDQEDFKNLVASPEFSNELTKGRSFLKEELSRQGETDEMILKGTLPTFFDHRYTIEQGWSASDLSFNRKLWNPDTLFITAYLNDLGRGGVITDYFGNFQLFGYHGKIGVQLGGGEIFESQKLPMKEGHVLFKLTARGDLSLLFDDQPILTLNLGKDLTKVKGGYVTCGKIQGRNQHGRLQNYQGRIFDLYFTMNELSTAP
ncbi:Arylsulfatase A [Arachidicoccus rhizosphaerae]|uniref:Arylsulfatase A n=1 Tax=Arachidicoccus rhizosphaerae TaxID=551991 RepID=A0A1H4AKD3_9BACT|nr:sulfatase [Arachidicoccus rhizosphaerae]SEA36386.1 Arylsulfatase A [Arachidicoccus rhizosphaerae]